MTLETQWWQSYRPQTDIEGRRPVFLDRDGVINVDTGYLHKPEEVVLTRGAGDGIRALNQAGYAVIVVTNQSGIGRGYFDWSALEATQLEIQAQLSDFGAHMDAVFTCPCHTDALPPYNNEDHPWRKPNGGMILHAAQTFSLLLDRAYIVGDRLSDMEAGLAAGLKGGLLLPPKGASELALLKQRAPETFDLMACLTLDLACAHILKQGRV